MKQAVVYGAGSIGRGFIGQVFHDSGYKVVFIDINKKIIDSLNKNNSYKIETVSNKHKHTQIINNILGINGNIDEKVIEAIAGADIMATSIGVNNLPFIAKNISQGIKKRKKENSLNILICENIINAKEYLKNILKPYFDEDEKELLNNTGLVETTIGRMVPVLPSSIVIKDPTFVRVEEYCTLPLDKSKFVGEIPKLKHAEYIEPFEVCEEKKLFIHNMSHALCAYFGYQKGYKYIWQAIEDKEIYLDIKQIINSVCYSIAEEYSVEVEPLLQFSKELIERFKNKKLKDTILRVGRDPFRKLSKNDRLIGALKRCKSKNKPEEIVLKGIAAAILFDNPEDEGVRIIKEKISEIGTFQFLQTHCGLNYFDAKKCMYYIKLKE